MAMFVQETPTRVRIVNPRFLRLAAYGTTDPMSIENGFAHDDYAYEGPGYDPVTMQQQSGSWLMGRFFRGIAANNGPNNGTGLGQNVFVNLVPGKCYCFDAFAFGSDVPENLEIDLRGNTAPWRPGNVMVVNPNGDNPRISWKDLSNNETGFEIVRERETSPGVWGNATTFTVGADVTSYIDTNAPIANYRYKIRAINSFGASDYTAPSYFSMTTAVPTTPPAAPSNITLTFEPAPGTSHTVRWTDNATNESSYSLIRQVQSGSSWIDGEVFNLAAGATEFQSGPPTTPATYRYSLRAVNAAGQSAAIMTSTFTVSGTVTPPAAPSNLSATPTASSINLSWTDNSNNESGFEIHRQTLAGGSTWGSDIFLNVGAGVVSYSDTTVSANTYRYQVRATNSGGASAYTAFAQAVFSPPVTIPTAPSNMAAVGNGSGGVNLSWADNSNNETRFDVSRQLQTGTTWGTPTVFTVGANTTIYVDSAVTAGSTYRYQVRAANSTGASAYTAFAQITVAAGPTIPVGSFLATYFNGTNFQTQVGTANHAAINFTYASGVAPFPGVNGESFSIRWEGDWDMQAGNYAFTARTDDGMRVWVDGQLIIDAWIDQWPTTYNANKDISAGRHRVKVEFYQAFGPGEASLSWQTALPVPNAPSNLSATIIQT